MKNKRVAICHQTMFHGNAIGNDILGMCDVLKVIGFEPTIICDYVDGDVDHQSVKTNFDIDEINDYEIVIYHHSIYWEKGGALVDAFRGTLLLKYHNITPPHFFDPYSSIYATLCGEGIRQTTRFVNSDKNHHWLADSEYNRADLIKLGEDPARISVLPPFNKIDEILDTPNFADYYGDGPFYGLFIGRLAPNKGHADLLRVLHSYRTHVSDNLIMRIVIRWDCELAQYRAELETLIDEFDLAGNVEFFPEVPQDDLIKLLRTSHVYACTSYHEGFCIPLIEAQAAGLPIVVMDSTAVRETAGAGQVVASQPRDDVDFLFYAKLIDEIFTNSDLRQTVVRKGYQNVTSRFTKELIENKFVEALLPFIGSAV